MHTHNDDITIGPDGARTTSPQKIVDGDATLHSTHNGGVCVHTGTYTVARGATGNGSVRLEPDTHFVLDGIQNGSLHVDAGATATIRGAHNGSLHVEPGGHLRVEPGGKLAGSINVGGVIENFGARGGSVRQYGEGEIIDMPGAVVKRPEIGTRGEQIYRW